MHLNQVPTYYKRDARWNIRIRSQLGTSYAAADLLQKGRKAEFKDQVSFGCILCKCQHTTKRCKVEFKDRVSDGYILCGCWHTTKDTYYRYKYRVSLNGGVHTTQGCLKRLVVIQLHRPPMFLRIPGPYKELIVRCNHSPLQSVGRLTVCSIDFHGVPSLIHREQGHGTPFKEYGKYG